MKAINCIKHHLHCLGRLQSSSKKLAVTTLALAVMAITASADQLVFYAFTNSANPNPATATNAALTATPAANGNLARFTPGATVSSPTYPVGVLNVEPRYPGLSGALANNSYFHVTLAAKPGYIFTATNVSLYGATGGGSANQRGVAVYSSVDSYGSFLISNSFSAVTGVDRRNTMTNMSATLGSGFQNLTDVTFRVYVWADASGKQVDMTNLVVMGTTSITTPPAITGLVGLTGNNQALLSWNPVEVATSYTVKRSLTMFGPYTDLVVTGVTGTNYTDSTAVNGTTYYYVVSAVNGVGEGPDSSEVVVTPSSAPSVPTGLVATAGDAQVGLTWNASSGALPPITYSVKRSLVNGGPYETIATNVASTAYTDLGLTNSVTYYYVVSAVNSAAAESANSSPASATPVGAPPVPTGLSGMAVGIGTEVVSWSASYGATSYTIKRAATAGGPYTTLQSALATTSFADTNLVDGTRRYYYVVSATGPNGTSADSAELSLSPPVLQFAFDFEDVVNSTITTDTVSSVTLNLRDGGYNSWDLHGAPGSGVAGNGRALDLSALPHHSPAAADGRVAAADGSGVLNFGTVPNFTVAFWLKPDSDFTSPLNSNSATNNPRLFVFGPTTATTDSSSPGMGIRVVTFGGSPVTNSSQPWVNGNSAGNTNFVTASGGWTFVALTYDRTNVTMFTGSAGAKVAPISSFALANQVIDFAAAGNLYIGNQQTMQKGVDGWYDNFRFYTGAADSNFLENVRWSTVGPVNLAATPGNSQVALNWHELAGATSYSVKRSTTSGGAYTTIAAGVLTTNYTDNTAVTGTTYYYTVSGVGALGESLNANEIMATPTPPPSVPLNLVATAGDAQVTLSWSASSGVALPITYNVRRSFVSGGPYTTIATNVAATGYADTGLTNGITCYYVVSAINANLVESANSAPASATPAGAPPVPAGLGGLAVGIGTEVVSWSPSYGATNYTIKRSTTSGGGYTVLAANLTTPSYTDTALVNGTRRYYYVVSATGPNGTSADSAELAVTPPVLQMRFEFEDAASSTTTTDLVSGVTLNLLDGSGSPTDLHGISGSGVMGNGRALDFSSNPYSSPVTGPLASVLNDPALGFGTVSNCTVTLWIKADSDFFDPVALAANYNNPRAFMLGSGVSDVGQSGVSLKINSVVTNGIQPYVNGVTVAYGGFISPPQAWRFVAITYDGTAVNLYYGSTNTAVSLLGSFSYNQAVNFGTAGNLLIGNRQLFDKSVDGWFDDVRFYTGTLNLQAVEAVRAELAPLPPPPVVSLTVSLSGTNILVSFPTQNGYSYQVEYRDNLSSGSWLPLGGNVVGDGTVKSVSDPLGSIRFYRLSVQ